MACEQAVAQPQIFLLVGDDVGVEPLPLFGGSFEVRAATWRLSLSQAIVLTPAGRCEAGVIVWVVRSGV
jgi:hypothetical protein